MGDIQSSSDHIKLKKRRSNRHEDGMRISSGVTESARVQGTNWKCNSWEAPRTMSKPALCSPSAIRIVELQDEVDRLKVRISVLYSRAEAYPKLLKLLMYVWTFGDVYQEDLDEKIGTLLKELGEIE